MTNARRDFLKLVAMGIGVVACRTALAQPAEKAAYVGIQTAVTSNLSRAHFYSSSGEPLGQISLDFRAHGLAEAGSRVVVFPRRPGDHFAVVDKTTLEILHVIRAPANRHFFGHGSFTVDGNYLLATENDLETLQGVIGIYDVSKGYRRIDQMIMPDAGPHEIARHPSKDLFFVALGGLETHPDYGRDPLNLHDFRSQIVALDFSSGQVTPLGYWTGAEGVSLRHLSMDARERLYIGGQIKNKERARSDSMIWIVEDGQIKQPNLPNAMKGYVSSVAASAHTALITSKQSGKVLMMDGAKILEQRQIEGAGAAALGTGLTVTSGFRLLSINGHVLDAPKGFEFDNHGLSLV